MTFAVEDRSFITRALAITGLITGLGVVVALGWLILARTSPPPRLEKPTLNSGDTPVVLVGGSLTIKAGDTSYPWTLVSGMTYQTTPNYPVKTIVLKTVASGNSDDGSDKLKIDVSNASSWEIDEYIQGTDSDVKAASITGVETAPNSASPIYLQPTSGYLCPVQSAAPITSLKYSLTSGCPDPVPPAPDPIKFSKVSITINNQPFPTGTLACYDSSDPKGTCRIVLRGH
jgi:hypothetical protein